jgi:hypothetical protein
MKEQKELKDNAAKAETVQSAGGAMTDEEAANVNGGGLFDGLFYVKEALGSVGGSRKRIMEVVNDISKVLK